MIRSIATVIFASLSPVVENHAPPRLLELRGPASAPHVVPLTMPVKLANGTVYRLPAALAAERPLLSNHPELLPRDTVPLAGTLAYQHLVEGGKHMGQSDPAVELAAIGLRMGGTSPLILDYEREGDSADAHARLAGLVRIARSHAPHRSVGVYAYPKLPYRKAHVLALAELAVERGGHGGMTEAWGRDALPKYERALQAAKPAPADEAALAREVNLACPSLYVPAGYGGDAEQIYRACRRLIQEAERWEKPVIVFVSPTYSGLPNADKGLLPPAEREAVLRACRDAGATPLIWFSDNAGPPVRQAARDMATQWRGLTVDSSGELSREVDAGR